MARYLSIAGVSLLLLSLGLVGCKSESAEPTTPPAPVSGNAPDKAQGASQQGQAMGSAMASQAAAAAAAEKAARAKAGQ